MTSLYFILLIVNCWWVLLVDGAAAGDDHWDYAKYGRDWNSGVCLSGRQQSPVHLSFDDAIYDSSLSPVTFNYYKNQSQGEYSNNGHSIQFAVNQTVPESKISGGGLKGTYKLHSLHFHWGQRDCEGSEHAIDYERAPLELHLVHFNSRYASFNDAKLKSDGLAVIGILFAVASNNSQPTSKLGQFLAKEYMGTVLQHVQTLPGANRSDHAHSVNRQVDLTKYIEEIRSAKFFRYSGSLTTPGCDESVTWTVIADRFDIGADLLAQIRKVELNTASGTKASYNFRAIQKLNRRNVFTNYADARGKAVSKGPPSSLKVSSSCTLLSTLILSLLVSQRFF